MTDLNTLHPFRMTLPGETEPKTFENRYRMTKAAVLAHGRGLPMHQAKFETKDANGQWVADSASVDMFATKRDEYDQQKALEAANPVSHPSAHVAIPTLGSSLRKLAKACTILAPRSVSLTDDEVATLNEAIKDVRDFLKARAK